MEFEGEFETHITLKVEGSSDLESARAWASRHRLKFLHILLERGQTTSQPMITLHGHGTFTEQWKVARGWTAKLTASGYSISRVKIEAAPGNRDIPDSDGWQDARYFEHHIKLILDRQPDMIGLIAVAQAHAAHVSRNALKQREDGLQERFVTQRCYSVGGSTARFRLERLRTDLLHAGFRVADVEQEFVVYDSDSSVDAGWISSSGESP